MAVLTKPDEWRPTGIAELEEGAWQVLRSQDNRAVIAGPGAGKTELLAQRACYLLETGIVRSPQRILAISFKRDAAKNLKDRVALRCNSEYAARFVSLTFDAFAKGLLDRFYLALVEEWRPSPDYEIIFTNNRTFEDFLQGFDQITSGNFERDAVLGSRLPDAGLDPQSAMEYAAAVWWKQNLNGGVKSKLTFPMIGRLVELLIRLNPMIRQALCATYSHVLLDEFQDTTHVQYDLVESIFLDSNAVLTAVGDNKQQIMRWAMALDDPFSKFSEDFEAERIQLSSNYRSSPELVRIQHDIARSVDESAGRVESRVTAEVDEEPCVILEFDTPEDEAKYLASFITSQIAQRASNPRDFAVLVRQRPDRYFQQLEPVFRGRELRVRNEGEIQDILAERLTSVLISFLRLGSRQRGSEHWIDCAQLSLTLLGSSLDDHVTFRLIHEELGELHVALRNSMKELPVSQAQLRTLIDAILDFLGEDNIKLSYPEYHQGDWYGHVVEKTVSFLFQSCQNSLDWPSALDDFEGMNSVPLLTIHKSKGLEYDTIVFLALDDDAWWHFEKEPQESRSTFFVAFSRAAQRVVFTYCSQRGGRSLVASLYGLLQTAGVPTHVVNST